MLVLYTFTLRHTFPLKFFQKSSGPAHPGSGPAPQSVQAPPSRCPGLQPFPMSPNAASEAGLRSVGVDMPPNPCH